MAQMRNVPAGPSVRVAHEKRTPLFHGRRDVRLDNREIVNVGSISVKLNTEIHICDWSVLPANHNRNEMRDQKWFFFIGAVESD
jgi:hypothetical protein